MIRFQPKIMGKIGFRSQQGVRHGALGLMIEQSNENTRRQAIYDACVEAEPIRRQ
jgi:hypothetical protein